MNKEIVRPMGLQFERSPDIWPGCEKVLIPKLPDNIAV